MASENLRDQLVEYIRNNKLKSDYVFITGDIRQGRKNYAGAKEYIKKICNALEVPLNQVFIVPGNHDVDRSIYKRDKAIKKTSFFHPLSGMQYGNYSSSEGTINDHNLKMISSGLATFNSFIEEFYSDSDPTRIKLYENYRKPHFLIKTKDFNILHINSTLVYTKYQERHELILGTWFLKEVLKEMDTNLPTIILSHFPITSLTQDEQKNVLSLLRDKKIRLWLCGHEHDHILKQFSDIYSVQAGELKQEENTNATVLVGEFNSENGTGFIKAHTWFPEGWGIYPVISSNYDSTRKRSEFLFRLESEQARRRVQTQVQEKYVNKLFSGLNPWGEEFSIRIINYEDRTLVWEWRNSFLFEEDKRINIQETLYTSLDDNYFGIYEINCKQYIFDDPDEHFWYYYTGTIQLINEKVIITFINGQRLSYIFGGSGASGYNYSGAWANAGELYSILVQ